jgi:hypothetical protein
VNVNQSPGFILSGKDNLYTDGITKILLTTETLSPQRLINLTP